MKSVTKNFNITNYTKWDLTEDQMATLYSIKIVCDGVTKYIDFYYHITKGDAFKNIPGGSIYFDYDSGYGQESFSIYTSSSSKPITATFYYFE